MFPCLWLTDLLQLITLQWQIFLKKKAKAPTSTVFTTVTIAQNKQWNPHQQILVVVQSGCPTLFSVSQPLWWKLFAVLNFSFLVSSSAVSFCSPSATFLHMTSPMETKMMVRMLADKQPEVEQQLWAKHWFFQECGMMCEVNRRTVLTFFDILVETTNQQQENHVACKQK